MSVTVNAAAIFNIKKAIQEIRRFPPNEWRRVDHFDRLVKIINDSINTLKPGFNVVPFKFEINHYSNTGKTINDLGYQSLAIYVDMLEDELVRFTESVEKVQAGQSASYSSANSGGSNNKVFIVHGRDQLVLSQTENMMRRLGLEPIVLGRMANQGLTIIEKFEKHSDVKYAVVLLTPDDIGALKDNESPQFYDRARQNVIFELGFFYGRLGRSNVCCLMKSGIEKPSDIDGIVYIPFISSVEDVELAIIREIQASGLNVKI